VTFQISSHGYCIIDPYSSIYKREIQSKKTLTPNDKGIIITEKNINIKIKTEINGIAMNTEKTAEEIGYWRKIR